MYAVVRSDLKMTPGRAAAQAGHAFVNSFSKAPEDMRAAYAAETETCKIVLSCPDQPTLMHLWAKLRASSIPCALVIESDEGAPDGLGVVTALGIGPVARGDAKSHTKGLRCM
jgi:peptidyl-tRNA hydrolase